MAQFRIEKSWHKKRDFCSKTPEAAKQKISAWGSDDETKQNNFKNQRNKKSLMSLPRTSGRVTSCRFYYTMLCCTDFPIVQADNVYQTKAFVLPPYAVPSLLGLFTSLYEADICHDFCLPHSLPFLIGTMKWIQRLQSYPPLSVHLKRQHGRREIHDRSKKKRDIKRTANMCREDMWRENIRTERTTFLENEDVPANYRCTRKTAERMEDNYYCWRLFPIMELLCKMRRKSKPEHKDEICVARWTGGIYIWPANLASTASTQANKQNNTSLRTGLRGPALTANTDIKRNNGRRRRKHSGKIGAKPW